ncbi:hypothetical protein RchiOBHm_Chr2g0087511 [Rosa chinensis]|uniref:Uncharacterized protein n=1 Tax=Rosa chinensis TaxID=74649 RepID=A0A2P6RIP1_ROSCH|nr:hypothetical protein RchiOBHm_Chr2g0087511 [Rosa chinensis]
MVSLQVGGQELFSRLQRSWRLEGGRRNAEVGLPTGWSFRLDLWGLVVGCRIGLGPQLPLAAVWWAGPCLFLYPLDLARFGPVGD